MTKEQVEAYALENILEADSLKAILRMKSWIEGALWMQEQMKPEKCIVCGTSEVITDGHCNVCGGRQ